MTSFRFTDDARACIIWAMKLTTRVTRRIEDIPREDWESVFPNVLEGYDFFRSLDESKLEQFAFYYIIVYDGEKAVGAAPCFSFRYSLDTSMNGTTRRVFNLVKKGFPNILSLKALACGLPMGQGCVGIAGRDRDVVAAILRKMNRIARREKARILAFKDFPRSYSKKFGHLIDDGFFKADSLPYAEMGVAFKNFEEYMNNRLSGASRYDLRRKFKRTSDANIAMEIVDNPSDGLFDEMYALYVQIVDKHEMGFEFMPKEFFKNIARNMPGKAKFFLWRIDGKLAAFLFALTHEGVFIDYYLGLDYEVAHKYHLFFLKFRDVLKWCLENNITRYEMGISGYEPKRRLGFDFTPLDIYIKHRSPIMNPIFKVMVRFLKFENFDPDLKAIKRSAGEKKPSDPKSFRPDNAKRPARQHSPAVDEAGVSANRD